MLSITEDMENFKYENKKRYERCCLIETMKHYSKNKYNKYQSIEKYFKRTYIHISE